ncbi:MAG: response regulator [Bacteroidota bacterium]|nr:response regulator [Bacteroidota bacterium]
MSYDNVEILYAEDSMDDATLAIRAFKKYGLADKLHHVKDGAEALDYIYCKGQYTGRSKCTHPKVIILDQKMPKMTGMEVLEKIKSDPNLSNIPVVILTSSKEDPDIKKCYDLGANSYIVKPVEIENFFAAIKDLGLYWVIRNQPTEY